MGVSSFDSENAFVVHDRLCNKRLTLFGVVKPAALSLLEASGIAFVESAKIRRMRGKCWQKCEGCTCDNTLAEARRNARKEHVEMRGYVRKAQAQIRGACT